MKKNQGIDNKLDPKFYQFIYQAMVTNTPDLVYLLDKDCSLIDCNSNFLAIFGCQSIDDKTVGSFYKHMKSSEYWTEKQVQMMKTKDIDTILMGKASLDQTEPPVIDQQDNIHHYVASRIPIFDDHQSVIALLVIFKEITELKKRDDQFEKIKQELEQYNAKKEQPVKTIPPYESPTEPLKVLVVEDNVLAQKAAQAVLMQVDCVVDLADSEPDVFALFKPGKYDMIFMDIGLEDTSGYMLAKQIRAKENGTAFHVPIIALTAYKAELLSVDCDYYKIEGAITKPLTLEQMRQLIQRYIHHIDVEVTGLHLASS